MTKSNVLKLAVDNSPVKKGSFIVEGYNFNRGWEILVSYEYIKDEHAEEILKCEEKKAMDLIKDVYNNIDHRSSDTLRLGNVILNINAFSAFRFHIK